MTAPVAPTVTKDPSVPPTGAEAPPRQRRVRSDGWLVTVLSFVLALVIGGVIMALADPDVRAAFGYFGSAPGDVFTYSWYTVRDAYKALVEGAVYNPGNNGTVRGEWGPITGTITTATPLICAGLGISLAFRSGLFNIGGQGQLIAGAMAAGYVGFGVSLPPVVHMVVAVLAGVVAGSVWGFIAGYLKARTGANEVVTTIMLNYVALYLLRWILTLSGVIAGPGAQSSKLVDGTSRLPHLAGASLTLNFGIVLALLAAGVVWYLLSRTVTGFRLRSVGANPAAARTAGMSVAGVTMTAMALSGALVGLGGSILTLGGSTSFAVTPSIDAGYGFDAITVALLGRNKPQGIVFAGLLLGALRQGGSYMQTVVQVPVDIVTVIQALIILFIAAPRLVRSIFRLRARGTSLTGVVTNLAITVATGGTPRIARHISVGVVQIVIGVLSLWLFGLTARAGGDAPLQFALPGAAVSLGTWHAPARPIVIVLSVLVILAGIGRLTQKVPARVTAAVTVVGVVLSFILWSLAGTPLGMNIVSLLQGSLFPAAIPLILGALAGLIGERAGVVNIAIEAQLLLGAFTAALLGSVVHNEWVGLLGGIAAGVLVAALLAVMAIRYLVDQVIVGVTLNLLALGLTTFLYNKILTVSDNLNQPSVFKVWTIPGLADIPIIGPVFFSGTIFLYLTYALVAGVAYALFRTRWGLRTRAVGEHPRAADTVGINVRRTRWRALLIAGVIAGIGGAFIVIGAGSNGTFQINVSAGKGYIALAAVIFGRYTPLGAVGAALLFGFSDQLQNLLSQAGTPIDPNLFSTLPYVVTLIAIAGFVGRVRAPAADGQPYAVG